MVAEKSGPSFASILTSVSIVMYTGGFLRVELEFNKQKDKVNQLESVVDSMKTSSDDIAQGKAELVFTFDCVLRNAWNFCCLSPPSFVIWALNVAQFQQSSVDAILLQECSIN